MVIGAPDAVFLRIFKPHKLGDFLKINSQKNSQKMMTVWRLGVRKSSFHGDSHKINHPAVVIWGPGAVFLRIFRPHTLGDFLKINSQKNSQKMMTVWRLGLRARFFFYF